MSKTKKKKPKHYAVLVVAYASVVVENADSESHALQLDQDEVSFGDFQMDEAKVERVIPDDDLENAKRNADAVAEDDSDGGVD